MSAGKNPRVHCRKALAGWQCCFDHLAGEFRRSLNPFAERWENTT